MIYPPDVADKSKIERHYSVNVQMIKQANPATCSKLFYNQREHFIGTTIFRFKEYLITACNLVPNESVIVNVRLEFLRH